ncbi:hypothetical protein HMPREF9148_01662 [Prevotella sp. F0091]|nr:hypothetical protein HMPREF9148_01662 [Prevotella sp. F0091]
MFLWCYSNNVEKPVIYCYKRKKNISSVVIKIHKLKIVGALGYGKRWFFR